MRKKIKRIVPFVLVGVLVSSFVMTNYNKAREAKAVVGVDDLAIAGLVTTLLLAYGYATTQYYNNTDGANALADEWEEEYNQARLTVINGGGGSDNGDDDDDKNKFEDTDGDGKITEKDIPPFSNFLTINAVTLSVNASLLLTPIVTKFITDKFCNGDTSKVECLADASAQMDKYISSENIDLSSYKYIMKKYNIQPDYYELTLYATNRGYICNNDNGFSFYADSNTLCLFIRRDINNPDSNRHYLSSNDGLHSVNTWARDKNAFAKYYSWNGPLFDNSADASAYEKGNSSRVDWVTPELQNTFDNKGNLELLPSFDPLSSYSMASQQALQELLSNLASSSLAPAQQLDLVNKFITGLKTSETPEPSPNPDPSPEPNPNPDSSNPDNGDGDNSGDSDIDYNSSVNKGVKI